MTSARLGSLDIGGMPGSADFRGPLPGDLVRVLKWIDAHLSEPIRIDTLATIAEVPARTLEAHFRQYLGTTPLGWLRQVRLAHARQKIVTSTGETSVTDAATASGFTQLGRFAGHYRAVFGESPSQTRRRAARTAGAEDIDEDAILLTWRAVAAAYQVAPQGCSDALEDLARAQQLAPKFGLPKALEAWCIGQSAAHNFNAGAGGREKSIALARQAMALAPNDALALSLSSGALTLAKKLDEADEIIEHAVAMDPWSAMVWLRRGWISVYCGDSDAAIRELNFTLRLMPFEPVRHLTMIGIGCAHFGAKRYDRAARWVNEGVRANPGSYWAERVGIAAAAHYGACDQARRAARELLRKDPDLTVEVARRSLPFTPDFVERMAAGLEMAGLPKS